MGISFRDLSYWVPLPGKGDKKKNILKSITGALRPGRFTVIMGASGAGKTSLLNLISGEARLGGTSGQLLINGQEVRGKEVRELAGFVQQDDLIMDTMTVREAVTMSALLRIPPSVSREEKLQKVDEILDLMQLTKAADTIIGSTQVKGVSGGERKRTSISMELVSNPSILFLDEPTSGLDTYTAYSVCKFLKELASSGRTIVATLHQPSSEIFDLIDDVVLLANGEIMYAGPADQVVPYFGARGYPCPRHSNPADFLFMNYLLDEWKRSDLGRSIELLARSGPEDGRMGYANAQKKYHSTFHIQLPILMRRAWKNVLRNRMVIMFRFLEIVVLGFFLDAVFWKIPERGINSQIQNRCGALFFLVVNQLFSYSTGSLMPIYGERVVFEREYGAGMYSLPAYFVSKVLIEIPFLLIAPFLLSIVTYFALGLQLTAGKFFIYVATVILNAILGAGIGLFAVCSFKRLDVTLVFVPLLLLPMIIFAGLFVNLDGVQGWIRWVQWISPMKYSYVALVKNELGGLDLPGTSPDQVLEEIGLSGQGSVAVNIIACLGLCILFWVGAYLGLQRLIASSRKSIKPQKQA
ncbi:P-loop containing nucleoside triphosphate hydrolase protein [Piptocephalis cylindrospora]|uniref:P-loop containing nucleoside triphosphate hydrolase protein n=1 Tax=Piptocephalis cylindrospora TaxID=1907219 RepID=A0A4V1IY13_9FUNG|nr:P-loop containing nucleoside triphosphate hydrolase protein [Piptocephalis cylindrospora]|eukprot:RKP12959.1 P-loop containing nucleoside triphosphate hydrolase protein [Piptocephalis cylindrospora]